jgi:FixJ family two-component response regulator
MRDDEKAVEHSGGRPRDGKEIHRGDGFPMIAQKGRPSLGRLRIPQRSPHPAQDGSLRKIEAKHFQFTVDARCAPCEIFRDHVALIDLQMPRMNGVETIQKIVETSPRARCVVLTTYRGDAQACKAFKAGAVGYLLKTTMRKDLIQTIRRVYAGQAHVPVEIAEEMTKHFAADDLSPREVEVLRSISGGRSNKIVADQLNSAFRRGLDQADVFASCPHLQPLSHCTQIVLR